MDDTLSSVEQDPIPPDLKIEAARVTERGSVGIALSGGGVRAALFSLGVLIGLVETGENRRVTHVSSVSGGSIINAAIAQACDFAECPDIEEFRKVAAPLANTLCRRGAFVFSWSALLALFRVILPSLTGILTIVAFAYGSIGGLLQANELQVSDLPWAWIAVATVAGLLFGLFLSRGRLQEAVYAATLATLPGAGEGRRMEDLRESGTTHVLVATELISGSPMYFARDFVCCPTFGWGLPGGIRVASAVYASAAFPAAFPVKRLNRRRFRFQNGSGPPPFPRLLKVNDGGVYNNLGTDWFDELDNQSAATALWQFGNIPMTRPLAAPGQCIFVNSGAASRGLHKIPPFLAVKRTMNVLYDNTVRPRLDYLKREADRSMDAAIVIDIRESPYHLADRHANWKLTKEFVGNKESAQQCQNRADAIAAILAKRSEKFWNDFAAQTSGTPTNLTRAGLESGARMMLHGYLSTIVALHVVRGVALPEQLKDEGYFLDLAGRPVTNPPISDGESGAVDGPGVSTSVQHQPSAMTALDNPAP